MVASQLAVSCSWIFWCGSRIFIIGQLENGIRVSTKDGFEISVDRTKLPTELDIEGDWYYVAETNNDTKFTEDGCRKRIGTVSIKQKEGTPEVILNGRKLLRAECGYANTQITGTAIPWKSDDAVVKLKEKELFLWLMTADDEPRYAHVSAKRMVQILGLNQKSIFSRWGQQEQTG